MNSTIQKRIEAINRGETPKGYKRCPIGFVPIDWQDFAFSDLFTVYCNYTDDLSKYPLYSLTLEEGITPKTERYERSHLVKKENSFKVMRVNDFAFNPMNVRFGAIARYKNGVNPISVSGYYDIFSIVNDDDLLFMESFITCSSMLTYYNLLATGSLVEKKRFHFSQFLNLVLPLPSQEERKTIGEILSQQDRIIDLKQRLIEEKRKQKKYLMQTLLTGKIRLPGFKGKWNTKTFCSMFSRITQKNDVNNNNVLTISAQYGLVNQEFFFNKSVASENKTNYFLLRKGDFAYNKSYSTGYPFGAIKPLIAYETGIVSPLYICFTPTVQNSCPKYFEHYFEGGMHNREIKAIAEEGARNHGLLNISIPDFFNTLLTVPPLPEQEAIAEILSTADEELSLLQREMEQERLRKKALMQLLLTGLVRVEEL